MANTFAYAKTSTKTETRMGFILNHFRSALTRLTDYNAVERNTILEGIEKEEIEALEFIGYKLIDNIPVVYVTLKLKLDFDEHHKLKSTQPLVIYENNFDDDSSPEIFGFIKLTQDTINNKNLISTVLYTYTKSIRENQHKLKCARIKYGTYASNISYDYSFLAQGEKSQSPEVKELYAECYK